MKRGDWLLFSAWLVALFGFCLSIFYGEILQHAPCPLCWYQRIALFPLVFLLGIAMYRRDYIIISYSIPLALFGFFTALFQAVKDYIPFFKTGLCSLGTACTDTVFPLLGNIRFPVFSAIGFTLLIFLLILSHFSTQKNR